MKFPDTLEALNSIRRRFFEKYNFPGVIGCIDCTHVAIFPPGIIDEEHPEFLYVNRKGYHSLNVQLICDDSMKILNVNALYPGSTNDAFIWNNSQVQRVLENLHRADHKDYYLLGDSGYPLRTYLLTPLEQEPLPNTPERRYNVAHRSTRNLIERCNGLLKARFRCLLKHRVLHYSPEVATKIVNSCTILHNMCIENNIGFEDEDEEIDLDLMAIIHNEERFVAGDVMGRINPELAEGRRERQRLINNYFRNRN